MEARVYRYQRRGQLSGRVGVGHRPAHGSAAADLGMPHETDRLVQERPATRDELGALQGDLAGERPDPQRTLVGADVVELRDPVDVNHQLRPGEAQVEQWNETLTSREHGAVEPEQRQGLLD